VRWRGDRARYEVEKLKVRMAELEKQIREVMKRINGEKSA